MLHDIRSFLAAFLAVTLPSAAAFAVQRGKGIGLPLDVSKEGWRIDSMLSFAVVSTGILFLIMIVWLFGAMLLHRRGKHVAVYDHGNDKKNVAIGLIFGFGIFLFVDGVLFYNSTTDLGEALWNWDVMEDPNALRIEVNGRQWAWQARYAGPDGEFATEDDVVTLNDIRVPVDTPVAIQLSASDVIHSFYLPNFRVKTDAVPGTVNPVRFEVDSKKLAEADSNQFDIACAQHCGTHHYKMRGVLTVYSQAEFDAWLAEASINAALDYDAGPDEAAIERGAPADAKYTAQWGWKWKEI